MITQFVETTDGLPYGKFIVMRMDIGELMTPTEMPDAEPGQRLLTHAGRRRFNDHSTAVYDLQRGVGFVWPLQGGSPGMLHYASEHFPGLERLVCPMYVPFVLWLHMEGHWGMGKGDITEIPRFLDLSEFQPE